MRPLGPTCESHFCHPVNLNIYPMWRGFLSRPHLWSGGRGSPLSPPMWMSPPNISTCQEPLQAPLVNGPSQPPCKGAISAPSWIHYPCPNVKIPHFHPPVKTPYCHHAKPHYPSIKPHSCPSMKALLLPHLSRPTITPLWRGQGGSSPSPPVKGHSQTPLSRGDRGFKKLFLYIHTANILIRINR